MGGDGWSADGEVGVLRDVAARPFMAAPAITPASMPGGGCCCCCCSAAAATLARDLMAKLASPPRPGGVLPNLGGVLPNLGGVLPARAPGGSLLAERAPGGVLTAGEAACGEWGDDEGKGREGPPVREGEEPGASSSTAVTLTRSPWSELASAPGGEAGRGGVAALAATGGLLPRLPLAAA